MNFSRLNILNIRAIITSVQVLGGFKMLSDTKNIKKLLKDSFLPMMVNLLLLVLSCLFGRVIVL